MKNGAVITADIVDYTKLSSMDQKKLVQTISKLTSTHKVEFYRGDSFQIYLKQPASLEIAYQRESPSQQVLP